MDVADFSLSGRAMRNVRQMVKRIERAGYETRVRRIRDLGEGELERIRRASENWRGTDTERGFSMALGRIGDPADGDCLIATAHRIDGTSRSASGRAADGRADDETGTVRRSQGGPPLRPVGHGRDLTGPDAPRPLCGPGMNELLIVAALQAAPKFGIRHVSLNFAMFRSALAAARRSVRVGPQCCAHGGDCCLPLPVVPDRVPVQVQREVPAPLGAALRGVRVLPHLPRIGLAAMQAEGFVNLALPRFLRRTARSPRPCCPRARGPRHGRGERAPDRTGAHRLGMRAPRTAVTARPAPSLPPPRPAQGRPCGHRPGAGAAVCTHPAEGPAPRRGRPAAPTGGPAPLPGAVRRPSADAPPFPPRPRGPRPDHSLPDRPVNRTRPRRGPTLNV